MSVFIPTPSVPGPRRGGAGRAERDVPYLLVHPPLTDPTTPYHSIPYLVGATRDRGFTDVRCVDANIDGLNLLAGQAHVAGLLERAAQTKRRVEQADRVSRADELAYTLALGAIGLAPDFASRAIAILRDDDAFYHHPTYRQASTALKLWLRLLCLDGVPGSFDEDFEVRPHGVANLTSFGDLRDEALIARLTRPFDPYLDGPFAQTLTERPWEVIGFSVSYASQLPFALRMARQARQLCGSAVIAFGGTDVCDVVRFTRDEADVWELFADADAIVPGEGETALSDLLTAVMRGESLATARGVMTRADTRRQPPIVYEDVATLPAPAYDVWDWASYWSPEPTVLYSPTRGCYWNKCTFCDYGLNSDRPTSPSRERPVETVVRDLRAVLEIGRTVYFAVDAMSPRYLRQLCEAMAAAGLGIRWSAELRLERTFPRRGMAERLRDAGCVAVSFGYESASQRILDLIDKGVRIEQVEEILRGLADADIGAQMMGFTGFPTERADEAERTYSYLTERPELWSIAAVGDFVLTPGSIVAKQPDRFGIELVASPPTDDLRLGLTWRDRATGVVHWPGDRDDEIAPGLRAGVARSPDGRPFVGGIDSAHTILYFARFGRALLPAGADDPRIRLTDFRECDVAFDNVDEFAGPGDVTSRYDELRRGPGAGGKAMTRWLDEVGRARRGERRVVLTPSGAAISLPPGTSADHGRIRQILELAEAARVSA